MNSYLFQRFNFIHLAIFYPLLINILSTLFDYNINDEIILVVKAIVGWQFITIGIYSLIIDRDLVRIPIDAQVFVTCGICIMTVIQFFSVRFDNFELNALSCFNIVCFTLVFSFFVGTLSTSSPSTAIIISRVIFSAAIVSFLGQYFKLNLKGSILYVPGVSLLISKSDISLIDLTLFSTSCIYSQMIVDGIQLIIHEVVIDGEHYAIFDKPIALIIVLILTFIGKNFNTGYTIHSDTHHNSQPSSNPPSYSTFNSSPENIV